MKFEELLSQKRLLLDQVSPCFCSTKLRQLRLFLQNGMAQSCCYIDRFHALDNMENGITDFANPSGLVAARKDLRKGIQSKECSFCWDSPNSLESTRVLTAVEDWSTENFTELLDEKSDARSVPTYLEVSFSNICNLQCSYCFPVSSSRWENSLKTLGDYPAFANGLNIGELEKEKLITNPALAKKLFMQFLVWLKTYQTNLKYLRITGGEPFLHEETLTLLSKIENPQLKIAINSNLSFSAAILHKTLSALNKCQDENRCSEIEIYASVDAINEAAEYIRTGLNYKLFINNLQTLLTTTSHRITIMCTHTLLNTWGFLDLLNLVKELKFKYPKRVFLNSSHVVNPAFLGGNLLPRDMNSLRLDALKILQDPLFEDFERITYSRYLSFCSAPIDPKLTKDFRWQFLQFIAESDRRNKTSIVSSLPQFSEMIEYFKNSII